MRKPLLFTPFAFGIVFVTAACIILYFINSIEHSPKGTMLNVCTLCTILAASMFCLGCIILHLEKRLRNIENRLQIEDNKNGEKKTK